MPQDLFVRRTPAGSVEVTARIANCTDKPVEIHARASFMDEQKFPTEDPSAWQTVFLTPRSIGTYREVSIGGSNVAYYLIEVSGSN
jgi:ABC-type molybdate transport system substrate-binding protein